MRPDEEMIRRWRHVESFLRAAICALEWCEKIPPEKLKEVSNYLDHNELGLAHDALEELVRVEVAAAWEALNQKGKTAAPYEVRGALTANLAAAKAIMRLGAPGSETTRG